jgi:hypothetical protein
VRILELWQTKDNQGKTQDHNYHMQTEQQGAIHCNTVIVNIKQNTWDFTKIKKIEIDSSRFTYFQHTW